MKNLFIISKNLNILTIRVDVSYETLSAQSFQKIKYLTPMTDTEEDVIQAYYTSYLARIKKLKGAYTFNGLLFTPESRARFTKIHYLETEITKYY